MATDTTPIGLSILDPRCFETHEQVRKFVAGAEFDELSEAAACCLWRTSEAGAACDWHDDIPEGAMAKAERVAWFVHADLTKLAQAAASPEPVTVAESVGAIDTDAEVLAGIAALTIVAALEAQEKRPESLAALWRLTSSYAERAAIAAEEEEAA